MNKDLRKVIKALEADGFVVEKSKKGHPVVYLNGKKIATFAGTPSDQRSFLNSLAPLKRAGFVWPQQR